MASSDGILNIIYKIFCAMPHVLNLETVLENPFPLVCIAGSTASGKSAIALKIAQRYNGIVINADSQQIYQGLPLLTAQPSLAEIKEIPHKLYQYIPNKAPGHNVMDWVQDIVPIVRECHALGYVPIVVGGTGFYLYALEEGLSFFPKVQRIQESELLERYPEHSLYEYLTQVDPVYAKQISKQDKQRILRALCVYCSTNTPLSYWRSLPKKKHLSHCLWYKIYMYSEKSILQQRIQSRFEQACSQGLCQEISEFSLTPPSPLSRAIGLKTLKAWQNGNSSWNTTQSAFLTETWQYAKRQRTWFKRYFTPHQVIFLE